MTTGGRRTRLTALAVAVAIPPTAAAKVGEPAVATLPDGGIVVASTTVVPEGAGGRLASRWSALAPGARAWSDGPRPPWSGPDAVVIASDGHGSLTAVWPHRSGLAVSVRHARSARWSSPQTLRGTGHQPLLAVSPDGAAVIGWTTYRHRVVGRGQATRTLVAGVAIEAAYRPPGAARFGAPEALAESRWQIRDLQIVVDADGVATAVWRRDVGGRWQAEAATRAPDDAWRVEALSDATTSPIVLALAGARRGALVAWGTTERLVVTRREATFPFAREQAVGWRPVRRGYPRTRLVAALGADGRAVVAWDERPAIRALARGASGWRATTSIGTGVAPSAVAMRDGALVAAWADRRARSVTTREMSASGWGPAARLWAVSPVDGSGAHVDPSGHAWLTEYRLGRPPVLRLARRIVGGWREIPTLALGI